MSERLQSLEWDFHSAVRMGDESAAHTGAVEAMALIESFQTGPLRTAVEGCFGEVQQSVAQLLDAELTRWRAWSEGRNDPDRDEISLFFAFYGAPKTWAVLLEEAEEICRQEA